MPMLFRFFCTTIILLFSCSIESNAQAKLKEKGLHDLTLRFNPLTFLETDGNVMLGVGYQFHRRLAITVDPGYIFFRPFDDREARASSISGIKIRSDVRFLFAKSRKRGRYLFFVGPEFHYKYVSAIKWGDFGINCLGGMCAYNQRAQYKELKKEIGGSAKMGTQIRVFNDRWNIELYWGIGFKFKRFEDTDLPIGGSFINEPDHGNIIINNSENDPYLIIPGGIKIIFILK